MLLCFATQLIVAEHLMMHALGQDDNKKKKWQFEDTGTKLQIEGT